MLVVEHTDCFCLALNRNGRATVQFLCDHVTLIIAEHEWEEDGPEISKEDSSGLSMHSTEEADEAAGFKGYGVITEVGRHGRLTRSWEPLQ